MSFSLEEIISATKGSVDFSSIKKKFRNISTDTRTIKNNDIFIAIKGERFDGHDFIEQAVAKGAGCVIVSRKIKGSKKATVVRVKDTVKALGHLAHYHRLRFSIPIIALTGSAGKTTTKDLIACVLGTKYKVLKNVKTENNHIGVPFTLLKLKPSHQIAVLELGTNQPGDIRWLAEIVSPDVAIFTNIGESHLEKLKSRAGVFREKTELLKFLRKKGFVIYNKDDDFLASLARKNVNCRKMAFSVKERSANQALSVEPVNNKALGFSVNGKPFCIKSPAVHNIYNALAAICCGRLYGIKDQNIHQALERHSFQGGRLELKRQGRYVLINDTYNANPVSFKSAIETLRSFSYPGPKIVVCSDMLELGKLSRKLHRDVGRYMAKADVDIVYTMGTRAEDIAKGLKEQKGRVASQHFKQREDLHRVLKTVSSPAVVLFKGSRGTQMEKTYEYFLQEIQKQR